MKIIVFDLETTGLPITIGYNNYYSYKDLEKYDTCRIVSMCWNIYNEHNVLISSNYHIIKNDDFDVDDSSYATKINGITKKMCKDYGKSIEKILVDFSDDCKDADKLVAHNIIFDYNIIQSECFRYNLLDSIKHIQIIEKFCTKNNGYNKKLSDLYKYYNNGIDFEGQHNAVNDVNACFFCYKKIMNR